MARHLDGIIRHFAHSKGVRQWWESYPELPCVPIEVGKELRLVSRRQAVRKNGTIYLPDFVELAQAIRNQPANWRVALAIDTRRNVTEPITQFLRDAGVRSLRQIAAMPFAVVGDEPIPAANLLETVRYLRSAKVELKKRLAALEFTSSPRPQWRSRLEEIQSVMTATRVHAAFRLGGQTYRIETNSGFDQKTGVIWLKRTAEREIQDALFEALMPRVFDESAPKFAACVLQKAVRQEFRESQPLFVNVSEEEPEEENPAETDASEPVPGETAQTHRPAEPDLSRNLPRPGPIPQNATAAIQRGIRVPPSSGRPAGTPQRNSVEQEDLHRSDLKQNQYAWHCQICLASRSPSELAPEGSYVALPENRKKLIEAHHADQVHADGARHAGNLVVLCHHHHHQHGNALSREQLTLALTAGTKLKKLTFYSGDVADNRRTIEGHIVTVRPPSTGAAVKFFFTTAHREHWLRTSAPSSAVVK